MPLVIDGKLHDAWLQTSRYSGTVEWRYYRLPAALTAAIDRPLKLLE
jgi:hypothetical protein